MTPSVDPSGGRSDIGSAPPAGGPSDPPDATHVEEGLEVPPHVLPLLDERTGIVRRLSRTVIPEHFPVGYELVSSRLTDTAQFCGWAADSAGAGYGFDGATAAVPAAMGEAIERYCGNLVPDGLAYGSYEELDAQNRAPLPPELVCLFADEQHDDPAFPFVRFTRTLPLQWVEGRWLDDHAPVMVPAALVWASHPLQPPRRAAPPISGVVQAGLAAGPSLDFACAGGVREVIERDAMMMSWHGRRGLRPLQVPQWLGDLAAGRHRTLRTSFVLFDDELGVPVIGVIIRDPQTGYLSLGTGCAPDSTHAAVKALGEALQLQLLLRDYDRSDSAIGRAAALATSPLRPWRADRRYGRSYRADLSDVRDYGCHLQLYLDPHVQEQFEHDLTDSLGPAVALADVARPPGAVPDLEHLVGVLDERGLRPIVVDVTTPDVRSCGLRVVRVLVPGCYGNFAAGLPHLGGPRMARRRAELGPAGLRRLPLPH